MLTREGLVVLVLLAACDGSAPTKPTASSVGSSTTKVSPTPAFDVEGFCEKTMEVGRKCEGDDTFKEGNKVGLCTSTLRAARDDDGVKLDDAHAKKCLADVLGAKPALPDIRTLKTLAQRFESCRKFVKAVPSLAAVKAVPLGTVKAGDLCDKQPDCVPGTFCPAPRGGKKGAATSPTCVPVRKAGEPCSDSTQCLGRCSRKDGNKCVSYCGSG